MASILCHLQKKGNHDEIPILAGWMGRLRKEDTEGEQNIDCPPSNLLSIFVWDTVLLSGGAFFLAEVGKRGWSGGYKI